MNKVRERRKAFKKGIPNCSKCNSPMVLRSNCQNTVTIDHIMPHSRGVITDGSIKKHKLVCAHCNCLRATCGHCWGAVACVRAVFVPQKGNPSRKGEFKISSRWKMHAVADQNGDFTKQRYVRGHNDDSVKVPKIKADTRIEPE